MNFDDLKKKVEEKKAEYDTDTRRTMRAVWASVGFIVGAVVGALVAVVL